MIKQLKYLSFPDCIVLIFLPMNISAQEKTENVMETIHSKDGTLIAYQRSGSGRPVVLVHGGMADHTRWDPVLPALEEFFTVYAIDRRGRGGSGDTEPYSIQREYEDIVALIDSIGGPVDLIGHSYGGLCALGAALLTDNIRRLILYEPPPPGFKQPPEIIAMMQALLEDGNREGLLSTFFLEIALLTPGELEIMRSVPAWKGRVEAAHTILRELKIIETHPPFDPKQFGKLKIPVLLMQGGESAAEYKETITLIHSMLSHSRIAELPGQQHVAMNTAPDLFVNGVLNFLKRH
jgi:pimeloyl-ACP methyl ester carboxylesterase